MNEFDHPQKKVPIARYFFGAVLVFALLFAFEREALYHLEWRVGYVTLRDFV